jgi:hypothetical protein
MVSGLRTPGADLGFGGGMEGQGDWAGMGAGRCGVKDAGLAVGPGVADVISG